MDNTQEIIDQARRDAAARRTQQARHVDQPWLWAFVGLSLTLILGVLFLPIQGLDYRLQMVVHGVCAQAHYLNLGGLRMPLDRKSTRLNSSHANISYAVFCLKKKKKHNNYYIHPQSHFHNRRMITLRD